jgi:protein-L-isoaspartate O-methyltransferase
MQRSFRIRLLLFAVLFKSIAAGCGGPAQSNNSNAVAQAEPAYAYRAEHDPDGIGKFYAGREIARVMGHEAADWLERPEREGEERPDLLIKALGALGLKDGDTAADIGAGSGYYTRRLARLVGEKGFVYAVDIQPEMVELLRSNMDRANIHNVRPVLGTLTDPKLPAAAVDLILLVDVYHEMDHPYEMTLAMCAALKPGGRLVFVEFRAEDPKVPIKRLHKMSEAQVRKEMTGQPLDWVKTDESLPWQHIVVFRKKETPSP